MGAMQPIRGYREALAYIYGLTDYERQGFAAYGAENYDLERVRHLLSLLGEPQRSFASVHIAGSKGKGSTAAMAESMLRAAGYRTGLYTSPHLHTFRERMRLDGALIPEAEVVRLVQQVRPLADQIPEITTFEVMTAMALAWFAQNEAEWVVLEVGLGGRLDATNVVVPAVAVITSISLDHVAILGDTLAQIAAEKAGIIKPGVGAFGTAMEKLKTSGLLEGVEEWLGSGAPFLGICLGMQMLFEGSAESEGVAGLGFLEGSCLPFREGKVPQIGWNQLTVERESRLLEGIDDGSFFYFLHGFYIDPEETDVVTATTEYGVRYPSVIQRGSVAAVQFHPEKSGALGLRLLRNWVESC
jgi:imidazole glycerol phosphate synthase glutamine amidotransferase subunit